MGHGEQETSARSASLGFGSPEAGRPEPQSLSNHQLAPCVIAGFSKLFECVRIFLRKRGRCQYCGSTTDNEWPLNRRCTGHNRLDPSCGASTAACMSLGRRGKDSSMRYSFIHTSDWQLGMGRWFLGVEGDARYNQARIDVIQRIGTLARERGV